VRLAYLGPAGTFSEAAALLYAPDAERIAMSSFFTIARAVTSRMTDEGLVAIENAIEGAVPETLDLLIHEPGLAIRQEVVLPILQCLLVKPGTTAEQVDIIYSHPQALGQCRGFIDRLFPKAHAVAALSTAAAVEQALQDPRSAAIGNLRAADLYGAEVLAQGIQDSENNETRFVVLAQEDHPPTGDDKTSLCFTFKEDKPGILVDVLQAFSKRAINLAKIESRPSKESLGRYVFLADLHGHRQVSPVKEALEEVAELSDRERFKVFGSYPRWRG
jgi:prephenate dehydratase